MLCPCLAVPGCWMLAICYMVRLGMEEYGVCQTSLEQIFNAFAAQVTSRMGHTTVTWRCSTCAHSFCMYISVVHVFKCLMNCTRSRIHVVVVLGSV